MVICLTVNIEEQKEKSAVTQKFGLTLAYRDKRNRQKAIVSSHVFVRSSS